MTVVVDVESQVILAGDVRKDCVVSEGND